MAGKIRVTLKKSKIGRIPKHRQVLDGLGLKKLNQAVELRDTPAVRGMVKKVAYLLDVQEV